MRSPRNAYPAPPSHTPNSRRETSSKAPRISSLDFVSFRTVFIAKPRM